MHNEKLRSRMGYLAPSLNSKMNTLMPYYSALAFLTEKYGFLNRNEEPAGFSIFVYSIRRRLVKSLLRERGVVWVGDLPGQCL